MNDLPAGRVKIMTWNIWWRFGPHWQDRQAGLLQTLRQVDADVVALQEVWGSVTTSQAHEFADQLGMHAGFVAPSYPPISDVPRAPTMLAGEAVDGVYPSDHRAAVCELSWSAGS
jgi:endonuclease/exonuclease/phosphatase family metal-dependent hydrolase